MKIVDNRKTSLVKKIEDIRVGECFIDDDGDITIKIVDEGAHCETSAVCLRNGEQWFPLDSHKFEIVSASVLIE